MFLQIKCRALFQKDILTKSQKYRTTGLNSAKHGTYHGISEFFKISPLEPHGQFHQKFDTKQTYVTEPQICINKDHSILKKEILDFTLLINKIVRFFISQLLLWCSDVLRIWVSDFDYFASL